HYATERDARRGNGRGEIPGCDGPVYRAVPRVFSAEKRSGCRCRHSQTRKLRAGPFPGFSPPLAPPCQRPFLPLELPLLDKYLKKIYPCQPAVPFCKLNRIVSDRPMSPETTFASPQLLSDR